MFRPSKRPLNRNRPPIGQVLRDPNEAEYFVHSHLYESIDDAEQYGIPEVYPEILRDNVRNLLAHRMKNPARNPDLLIDPNDPDCVSIVQDGFRRLAQKRIAELAAERDGNSPAGTAA